MGLDINAAQFLIAARQAGTSFGSVLMLGRQSLNVFPARMAQELARHALPNQVFLQGGSDCAYAEPLFTTLGASRVASLDVSDFEGAEFIHDLNLPVKDDMKERFDVVYDGGTLEHVFNFPVALRNCMEMLRPNGCLFIHTCANNLCGHGFYQFSPELFFRTLGPENGFELERMVVHVIGPYGRWYEVNDPNAIRSRVELITFTPIQMMVRARRKKVVPIFAQIPQQSDYTTMWQKNAEEPSPASVPTSTNSPRRKMFPRMARLFHVVKLGLEFYRRQSLRNRKFFRPVPKP